MADGFIRVRTDADGKRIRTSSSSIAGVEVHTQYVRQDGAATGTVSSVNSAASDGLLLAANAERLGALIYNDDANALYVLLGSGTASATNYSVRIESMQLYVLDVRYTGAIRGIWAGDGSGAARVTEFTP